MGSITERPVLGSVRLETFNLGDNPGNVWTDWTAHVVQITTGRGGRQEGIVIANETGVLTARLRGIRLTSIEPVFLRNQRIRLVHVSALGVRKDIYTGRVLDVTATTTLDGIGKMTPVIEINAVDNMTEHDNTTRFGAMPPTGTETFAQRIDRLKTSATVPVETPTITTGAILGRTVYESSLSNHFTMACNTVGAMWWVGADGVTRFAFRKYNPSSPLTFLGVRPPDHPPGALHYIRPIASAGSSAFFNRALMHNHAAELVGGEWRAADYDVLTVNLGGAYGFSDAEVETNHAANPSGAPIEFYNWLEPTSNFEPKATGIVWNAQEDIDRVPDIEIGRSVYLPSDESGRDPWPWNVVIGVRHVITPARWLTEITLVAVRP